MQFQLTHLIIQNIALYLDKARYITPHTHVTLINPLSPFDNNLEINTRLDGSPLTIERPVLQVSRLPL